MPRLSSTLGRRASRHAGRRRRLRDLLVERDVDAARRCLRRAAARRRAPIANASRRPTARAAAARAGGARRPRRTSDCRDRAGGRARRPSATTSPWPWRHRVELGGDRLERRRLVVLRVDLEQLEVDLLALRILLQRVLEDFLGLRVAAVGEVDLGFGDRIDFVGVDVAEALAAEVARERVVAGVDDAAAGRAEHRVGLDVGARDDAVLELGRLAPARGDERGDAGRGSPARRAPIAHSRRVGEAGRRRIRRARRLRRLGGGLGGALGGSRPSAARLGGVEPGASALAARRPWQARPSPARRRRVDSRAAAVRGLGRWRRRRRRPRARAGRSRGGGGAAGLAVRDVGLRLRLRHRLALQLDGVLQVVRASSRASAMRVCASRELLVARDGVLGAARLPPRLGPVRHAQLVAARARGGRRLVDRGADASAAARRALPSADCRRRAGDAVAIGAPVGRLHAHDARRLRRAASRAPRRPRDRDDRAGAQPVHVVAVERVLRCS